ncbi:MAG: Tetrahydromethanopterin S-methyltransferase subunit B [Methanoculleus marisnigri]|jgi:Tetrahydromethanopterin S-methyltransferase, subunit B|uniref:Tetrahydromethanopterin S-methyltransferase subunit B n=1 Tax=Methanoculleus marisnigri TaxID=2198 RepID=A0A124FS11_9EURY|nr:tetrahydromethanopterin S-methyltransferase subunit B [Methanoculleus marisnigri]KUK60817.1 MAG: Tetrahydromethanopterin S-methyltransferase subunit B [Methanoculleus marisnigri]KUL00725.1 MAG: Tetrahydromethanopterin S-methyltransferase subunit B [Methanoculleus marisnigri]
MAYIQVLPEFGLVVDPMVGIITTAGVSYTPVLEQVAELEKITDDLVGMLSGEGSFLASFPNREGVLNVAGGVNAFWYGMAIGLLIAGVVVLGLL